MRNDTRRNSCFWTSATRGQQAANSFASALSHRNIGAVSAGRSRRRPQGHEKATPGLVAHTSCLFCDSRRPRTVVPGAVPDDHGHPPHCGQQQFRASLHRSYCLHGPEQHHISAADVESERRHQVPADFRWRRFRDHGRRNADLHVLLWPAVRAGKDCQRRCWRWH